MGERAVEKEEEMFHDLLEGTETIFFVDDEDMVIDVGMEMMKSLGYEVFVSSNGKDAIEFYETHKDKIDMFILDMILIREISAAWIHLGGVSKL